MSQVDRTADKLDIMVAGRNYRYYLAEARRLEEVKPEDALHWFACAEVSRKNLMDMREGLVRLAESTSSLSARCCDYQGRAAKRADEAIELIDRIDRYLEEGDDSPPPFSPTSFLDKLNAKAFRKREDAKAEARALGTRIKEIDRDTRKPDPRSQYDGNLIQSLATEFRTHTRHVVNTLNLSGGLEEGWTDGVLAKWFREYRKGRKAGAESRESVALANALALI